MRTEMENREGNLTPRSALNQQTQFQQLQMSKTQPTIKFVRIEMRTTDIRPRIKFFSTETSRYLPGKHWFISPNLKLQRKKLSKKIRKFNDNFFEYDFEWGQKFNSKSS